MYLATVERYARQDDPPVIRRLVPGEPVMIRLVPKPDLPINLHDKIWAHEVVLGPFMPE